MDYVSGLSPFFLYAVPRLLATVASSRPKEKIYLGKDIVREKIDSV
jgi:hypothetical protein